MREINRTIASAIIFSKDKKLLMGKKDPTGGGVFSDCWHIPGGGVDEGETLKQCVIREVMEEVGLDVSLSKIVEVVEKNNGVSEKTLKETGEKVICHMQFNYFEIYLDQDADQITLTLSDDLVEARRFDPIELNDVQQIPGGKEFFQKMGYCTMN